MASRVYADFNGIEPSPRDPSRWAIALDTLGSLRDLSNAGIRLIEGVRLVVYDESDAEEDLEGEATVYFESRRDVWLAELDEHGYRYVPKRDRAPAFEFLCLRCRVGLPLRADVSGVPSVTKCPRCGEDIRAAIAAP